MKTQSRTEYLMECLAYHEQRIHFVFDDCTCDWCVGKRAYHTKQVKWFLRKLSEPVRSTPKVAPKPDFDKPFRDSIEKAEKRPFPPALLADLEDMKAFTSAFATKKPQYPEEDYASFDVKMKKAEEEFREMVEKAFYADTNPPKPNLFKQLWTFLKGF